MLINLSLLLAPGFCRAGSGNNSVENIGLAIERSRVRFPGVNVTCSSHFSIHSTPYFRSNTQIIPGHSAKRAFGRLRQNTHAPFVIGLEKKWCCRLYMGVLCTQSTRRDGAISRGTSHVTAKQRCKYNTFAGKGAARIHGWSVEKSFLSVRSPTHPWRSQEHQHIGLIPCERLRLESAQ